MQAKHAKPQAKHVKPQKKFKQRSINVNERQEQKFLITIKPEQ